MSMVRMIAWGVIPVEDCRDKKTGKYDPQKIEARKLARKELKAIGISIATRTMLAGLRGRATIYRVRDKDKQSIGRGNYRTFTEAMKGIVKIIDKLPDNV